MLIPSGAPDTQFFLLVNSLFLCLRRYDQGIQQDFSVSPPKVTHVGGRPLEPDRIYRVATKIGDLTNGQSMPFTDYFLEHPEEIPPKGAYVNIHSELMSYFARNLWRRLWDATTIRDEKGECLIEECSPESRLTLFDRDGDGVVTVEDIQFALRDYLGYSIDERELTMAEFVHSIADTVGDGEVTLEDFGTFLAPMLLVISFVAFILTSTLAKLKYLHQRSFVTKSRKSIATMNGVSDSKKPP